LGWDNDGDWLQIRSERHYTSNNPVMDYPILTENDGKDRVHLKANRGVKRKAEEAAIPDRGKYHALLEAYERLIKTEERRREDLLGRVREMQ
jgi:hypothetical protein